jgi:hypothetical protein
MEAITSRPLLLAGVGRASRSGGQTTLYLTPLHGKANLIKTWIANIHGALQYVRAAAEQIKSTDPWGLLLRYVSAKIAPVIGPFRPPTAVAATDGSSSFSVENNIVSFSQRRCERMGG